MSKKDSTEDYKNLLRGQLEDLDGRVSNALQLQKTNLAQSFAVQFAQLLADIVRTWTLRGSGLAPLVQEFEVLASRYLRKDKDQQKLLEYTSDCIHRCTVVIDQLQKQSKNKKTEKGTAEKPSKPTELIESTDNTRLPPRTSIAQADWKDIENEFGITKMAFARKINFVSDKFRREIIFRDVEHASLLASYGFSKPAVILAGGVIEELLRLYLKHKNIRPPKDNFDEYIKTCEQGGLLKLGIPPLSNSVRHFRNLVHLSKEKTKKYTLSKSTAKGAVASIFTIARDF